MTYANDNFEIDTPENVVFGYEVAGIGSRFLAAMADTLAIVGMYIGLIIIAAFIFRALPDAVGESAAAIFLSILGFVTLWGYYVFFEWLWNGQTPGKRWVGLRVIKIKGTPISLVESGIRNLIRFVDFLPLGYGFGIVTMFIQPQSRRLGDLAAGTLVVYEKSEVSLKQLKKTRTAPIGRINPVLLQLPLDTLTETDLQAVEKFLDREASLSTRIQLADSMMQAVHVKLGAPTPPSYTTKQKVNYLRQLVYFARTPDALENERQAYQAVVNAAQAPIDRPPLSAPETSPLPTSSPETPPAPTPSVETSATSNTTRDESDGT